jgi:hypothetical protein
MVPCQADVYYRLLDISLLLETGNLPGKLIAINLPVVPRGSHSDAPTGQYGRARQAPVIIRTGVVVIHTMLSQSYHLRSCQRLLRSYRGRQPWLGFQPEVLLWNVRIADMARGWYTSHSRIMTFEYHDCKGSFSEKCSGQRRDSNDLELAAMSHRCHSGRVPRCYGITIRAEPYSTSKADVRDQLEYVWLEA